MTDFEKQHQVLDSAVSKSVALPDAAEGVVNTVGMELGGGHATGDMELEIVAPALTTVQLPDDATMTYHVEHSDSLSTGYSDLYGSDVLTQTGAAAAGAAADTKRVRLPGACKRYVRLTVTAGATATDSSAVSATLQARF